MRILLVSDSPFQTSAYASQARMLAPLLKGAGHDVLYFGTTYYGSRVVIDGVDVIGGIGERDMFGSWMMGRHAADFKADIILTLKDPYVYDARALSELQTPWVPFVCVDTEPLSLTVKSQMTHAMQPLAATLTAQQAMQAEDVRTLYTPLGVDAAFWTSGDRAEARKALGIPDDVFMPLFVGDNRTNPSRKGLDQLVLAWRIFLDMTPEHNDAVLYLHTSMDDHRGGLNVTAMLNATGITTLNVRSTDKAHYESQIANREFLRTLYRAADVLVGPSTGEGFWVTGVEAQACGCPVIGCDFAAQRETARVGWRIAVTEHTGETRWCSLGAMRFVVKRSAIVTALQAAAKQRGDDTMRQHAHKAVQMYDWKRVFAEHWQPALSQIAQVLEGDIDTDTRPSEPDAPAVERAGADRPDAPCPEPEADRGVDSSGVPGNGRGELQAVS